MQQMKECKLVLLGDGGVGKTAYLNRVLGGGFIQRYFPEPGVTITPVVIDTPDEKIKFNIWTPPGQERITGSKTEVFTGADAALIMLSDSNNTLRSLGDYKKLITQHCGNIPVIILFNKCELKDTEKLYQKLLVKESYPIIKTSCKNNLNIKEPLVELSRRLSK